MELETFIEQEKAVQFFGVFLAVCILVIIAIMLDLWDGVYTARKTHQRVHSHKLRVTVQKVSEYFRFIVIGFLVDCLGFLFDFYTMPFVAVLFGFGLIVVEAKSMFEHAGRRKSAAADQLIEIAKEIVLCAKEKDANKIVNRIIDIVGDDGKHENTDRQRARN